MVGRKEFEPKIYYNFSLSRVVPEDDLYRKIDRLLDLSFLYKLCKDLYGKTGNPSLDPVVFFKIQIIGYFENIISDRELARRISDSLSFRLFLRYDIDEPTPWHSTISRTRARIPEAMYIEIFNHILRLCIENNLVDGSHISIDSTIVKANASMDSLERKRPVYSIQEYRDKVLAENDPYVYEEKKPREKKQNDTHRSKRDPDARIAKKSGKPLDLYYKNNISTDPKKGVIIHAEAVHANMNDVLRLVDIIKQSNERLEANNLQLRSISADKQYCNGKRLKEVEALNIDAYIPLVKQKRKSGVWSIEKFMYDEENDWYMCPNGKKLSYEGNNGKSKRYRASFSDCNLCPFKKKCITKQSGRVLYHPVYKEQYDNLKKRLQTPMAKRASKWRKVVERAFGELTNNLALRKVNTLGLENAQKKFIMAACVYNLKKYLKYGYKYASSPGVALKTTGSINNEKKDNYLPLFLKNYLIWKIQGFFTPLHYCH